MKKIGELLDDFKQHLIESFIAYLNEADAKNKKIWEKVNAEHQDIDETILHIDYIGQMQNDEIYEELYVNVKSVQNKKNLLDTLQIKIAEKDFNAYLGLYGFPNDIKDAIEVKAEKLTEEQIILCGKIANHAKQTKVRIKAFKGRFQQFQNVGLQTRAEVEQLITPQTKEYYRDLLETAERDNIDDVIWDPKHVSKWAAVMHELNLELSEVEEDAQKINKRQEALGIDRTEFPELQILKNEIKPCTQLWEAITQFNEVFDDWWTKAISQIDLHELEDYCADWYRKLTFAKRGSTLNKFAGPMTFVDYMGKQIEKFSEYMPLLQALKIKGLEIRHIRKIREETDVKDFNMGRTNFRHLQKKDLHIGKKLEKIKVISDLAAKEYAIRLTIEAVDQELNTSMLNAQEYKETKSYILKGIEEDLNVFKECELRLTAIAYNPFAKIYRDRIERLVKDLKFFIDFYNCWRDVQKYWAYLLPIFKQKDIADQMADSHAKFVEIDGNYRDSVAEAGQGKVTYKQFARSDKLFDEIEEMQKGLEILMRSLVKYLECKREYFPRLYFLSNEQIIEIVGVMENIGTLERNLFKMFEGIDKFLILYQKQLEQIEQQKEPVLQPAEQQLLGD